MDDITVALVLNAAIAVLQVVRECLGLYRDIRHDKKGDHIAEED